MDCARAVSVKMSTSQRTPTPLRKSSKFDRFGDANSVNSSNFNATTLRFAEKFEHPFSQVFLFGNMFHESHGFVAVPVTSLNNFVSLQ